MADLPEADLQADNRTEIHRPQLSESTQRKLGLQWEGIRESQKLTEKDLVRYDTALQNYHRVTAKWPRFDPRRRDPRYTTQATYRLGEAQSESAAKARFGIEEDEYWLYWCSSGADSKTYATWLDTLKQDIVDEFKSLWKGRSAATDRWFEKTCKPAIEKVLSPLIERRTGRARKVEISRLDREGRREAWAHAVDGGSPKTEQSATPKHCGNEPSTTKSRPEVSGAVGNGADRHEVKLGTTDGRRRGPKPITEAEARHVAEIVRRVAPDGAWRARLDDVGFALDHGVCNASDPESCDASDHEKIPLPRGWRKKGANWLSPPDHDTMVKAIKERLDKAGEKRTAEIPA
jgi:hypothetical protein